MRTRGICWAFVGLVLAVASACVAEPGSSGPPDEPARTFATPSPSAERPSPSPTPAGVPSPTADVTPTPAAAPSPATGSTIVTLTGNGSQRSGPFAVDEDWAIAWQHDGRRLFSIQLIPADEDVFGELVVSTTGPSAGSSPMYRAGTFVVQVYASEPWVIRILDFLPVPVRSIPAELAGTGPTNTDVFAASEPFLIEWTTDRGVPFAIELVTLTMGEPLLIVAAEDAQASCHEVSVADEFYLHVVTDAGWTIALRPSSGEAVCPAD